MSARTRPGPYSAENYRVEESVVFLMRQIVTVVAAITDQRMAEHGLTDAQWKPLLMIEQGQCSTAAELARLACVDTGAVTRMVDRLEAKGLLQRTRSREDRRIVKLELTEDGAQAMEVVPHVLADMLNAALAGFTKSEVVQFKDMLRRMLANARQMREDDAGSPD